jgi:CRISPR-associated protein Cas1
MLKRTLFFGNPYHLRSELDQLVLENKSTGEIRTIPAEDLGFVILEHPQITFSQGAMGLFLKHNVAAVFCDEKFLPQGMLLNLDGNNLQSARFRSQQEATEPLKKQLWKQTIVQKIRNQALLLHRFDKDNESLIYKSKQVKSGDPTNEEAKAASIYWKRLIGSGFTRERFGDEPNAQLNYSYAILRAAVARALSGSGLHPTIGIFHRNQYNSYCLADDVMEPYRPFADLLVMQSIETFGSTNELNTEIKAHLLGVLSMDTVMGKRKRPLMVALSETTSSLADCYAGKAKKLKYPSLSV